MAVMPPDLDPVTQRQLAAGLFNLVWTYLEKPDRTPADDDAMLHAAHASRHHWTSIGTARNLARGDWQISRVYAVLGRAEPAAHHARRYLEACEQHGLSTFDFAFANEALARAAAAAGDAAARGHFLAIAWEQAARVEDAQDRQWLEQNLASIRPVESDASAM
jgi:hypothetical protein